MRVNMFILFACAFLFYGVSADIHAPDNNISESDNAATSKYYFEAIFLGNYHQALQFCNYHGMVLLSIESAEEDAYLFRRLQSFLGDGGFTFWTSGTRLPQDHWVWLSTGKPIVYSPWTTQPMNANKCLDVSYNKGKDKLAWNAVNCSLGRHTICETPSSSVAELAIIYRNCNLTMLN